MNGLDTTTAYHTLSGATMLGFLAVALFFLRFWKRTRDRLFLLFAISFFVMGLQRAAVLLLQQMDERTELGLYSIRFIAFLIILYAIVDKNRMSQTPRSADGPPSRSLNRSSSQGSSHTVTGSEKSSE